MKLPKGNSATPLKRAVCFILAAILLFSIGLQSVWATEDALDASETEEIQLLEEEEAQYYTVTFYIDAATSSTITVKNGDYCIEPEVPEIPAGMNSFLGWFLEDEPVEVGNYFVFEDEPIDEDIVLTAQFSPDYLVHFLDIAGQVAYSALVEPDEYITAPELSLLPPAGTLFTGKWRLEDETEPFDFETQSITGNFTFLPILEDLYLVQFVTDGTLEEPQTIAINGLVTEPENEPSRPGYRFSHWSLEENGAAYDFSTPVTSDLTIYAVWEAEDVEIRVVYWLENENLPLDFERDTLSNYSYATALNYEVAAGSEIYADASSLNISTQSAISLFPSGDTAFSIATLQVDANGSASNGAPYASFYTASAVAENPATVSGDGSTVINVYLTRKIYHMNFVIDSIASGYKLTLSETMQELMGLSTDEFTSDDNGVYSYTVYAKIGMQVSEQFPSPFYGNSEESHFTYSKPNSVMRGWGPWKTQSMTVLTTKHLMTDTSTQYADSFDSATNTATYKSRFDSNVHRTVQ
ncbi:MAG: InlB B-repeat-containing protein [Oscillospiraceae bacterium]|nr:InlB B-repeat-containing protein [Oscillospiraceae bacterium]